MAYPGYPGQPYQNYQVTTTTTQYPTQPVVYQQPMGYATQYVPQPAVYQQPVYAQPVYQAPAMVVPQSPGVVMNMSSRKIALYNTHHNKYLFAEHGSLYTHNHLDHGNWFGSENHHGHFHMETQGNGRAQIRCHHGKYIAINHHGHIHLTHHKHEIDSLFTIEYHPEHHGKLGLRGNGGRYLGIAHYGHVKATHSFGHDELFQVVDL